MSNKQKKALKRKKKLKQRNENTYWCRFCGKRVGNEHNCPSKGMYTGNIPGTWSEILKQIK